MQNVDPTKESLNNCNLKIAANCRFDSIAPVMAGEGLRDGISSI